MFAIRSYTLPSGGPVRKIAGALQGSMGLSAKQANNQLPPSQSCYESKPNFASLSVWGEPSSGNDCLDYDTIHHFPSAQFQRVMVEPLS